MPANRNGAGPATGPAPKRNSAAAKKVPRVQDTRESVTTTALEAASHGFRVFPLAAGLKVPTAGSRGFRDASADAEAIATAFSAHPGAGLGIATGTGLLVLDVDGEAGRTSLKALEAEHGGLPKGYRVRTPSGGFHAYLRVPAGVSTRTDAGRIALGIDLRGDGGYVVAPPTVLADGRRYRVRKAAPLPPLAALPLAPAWLLKAARRPEPSAAPAAPTSEWVDLDAAEQAHVEQARPRLFAQQGARLDALSRAATPRLEDYRGERWDDTVHAVACELARIARMPSPDPAAALRRARAVLTLHAPTDQDFGEADHERIWRSALSGTEGQAADPGLQPLDLPDAPEPAPTPPPTPTPDGKRSAADVVVDIALRDWRLHVDPTGDVFAVPATGVGHVARRLRGGKLGLRQALAAAYRRDTGKTPSQQALADALTTLEGVAQEAEPVELHQRVAEHGGALWIDLGDTAGHVVRVADGAWSLERSAPVLFTRTEVTGAMPLPERGGDLADLWQHLNVSPADRALLLAVLVAAFVPNIPHPILDLEGEQGSGKSTLAKRLVDLLDPSPVPMRKAPRDPEAWVTAAAGSWVVSLDNLSALPEWLSDSLCRASTGEGDVRRQLYTDGGLSVFAFRRVVIVNGIDLAGIRGDLAERLVTIRPPRMDVEREEESVLDAEWRAVLPLQLGALLDLLATVWGEVSEQHKRRLSRPSKRWGEVGEPGEARARAISGPRGELGPYLDHLSRESTAAATRAPEIARAQGSPGSPGSPSMRMADFARIVRVLDGLLGTSALERYADRAADLSAETLNASPFVSRLLTDLRAPFSGTADQLRALLTSTAPAPLPRGWPANARIVTGELRRHAPALRRQGWTVTDEDDRKRHHVVWHLTPPAIGDPLPALRCRACADALTTPAQRAAGLCAKQDGEHQAARLLDGLDLAPLATYREDTHR